MSDVETFVYVIAIKDCDKFKAPVKIGVSASPWGRLDTLQTACPYDIGIVGVLAYPSREIALQMEDCFHSTHKKHRTRGEWFDIEPNKAVAILRLHLRFGLDMFSTLSDDDKKQAIALTEAHLPPLETAGQS